MQRERTMPGFAFSKLRRSVSILIMASALAAHSAPSSGVGRPLPPCPDSPNCVCSQATDPRHAISPLQYTGASADAMRRLQHTLSELPRVRIVTASDVYLHAEFTSAVLRFVDDIEFVIDPAQQRIDVRSASRVGHYDFGVNRKRVETIRRAFERAAPSGTTP